MSDSDHITYSPDLAQAVNRFGQLEISADAPELWVVLTQIAHTGLSCYPWEYLSQLLSQKIDEKMLVLQTSSPIPDFADIKARIRHLLMHLPGPPFTLQRLCELVVSPEKWGYTTTKRYVHAIEKVLTVTSYLDTLSPQQYSVALQEQFENMRAIKTAKKTNDDSLVPFEENGSLEPSTPAFEVVALESDNMNTDSSAASATEDQVSHESNEEENTSAVVHTDTPAIVEEVPDFSSPPVVEEPNPSAMDVDV